MKDIIGLMLCVLLIASCNQINYDRIAYRITEKDLIPEGITYSSTTNSFYISSIHKAKILQINAITGEFKDFTHSDLSGISILGLIVDEALNQLWACGNITENDKNYSMVIKFNLTSGKLLKTYSYNDLVATTFNDLAQDEKGNVYFTNSKGQRVYKIDNQSDSLSVFFDGVEITHPNGITISHDNKYLYIASTDKGIRVLDIEKREIIGEPDILSDSEGIDGLKYYKKSLIGIQNAVEVKSQRKISRFYLDESGTKIIKIEIIDQDNPLFDIPTTFVIVKNNLYCLANSQLENFSDQDNEIINPKALKDILILKYELNENCR